MKLKVIKLIFGAAILGAVANSANAAFIYTINQVGNNVVGTGTGSLNTTGMTFLSVQNFNGTFLRSGFAQIFSGHLSATDGSRMSGSVSGPTTWGSASTTLHAASSSSGDDLGFQGNGGLLYLPTGYVSGAALLTGDVWNNTTLAALELTTGIYNYTVSPNGDTISVLIGQPVPEPASMSLIGLGLLGFMVQRSRRTA